MMRKNIPSLLFLVFAFAALGFAQTGLPVLKKGESYSSVRKKMLKAGWKPFRSPDADECIDGDSRCAGRPEMQSCSGTGVGACAFTWKRRGRLVTILTVGEQGGEYSGYRF